MKQPKKTQKEPNIQDAAFVRMGLGIHLTLDEITDIKAMAFAHPRGIETLINKICGCNRTSFKMGDSENGRRATDFAEGRRSVGIYLGQLREMKMPGPHPVDTGPHAVPKGPPPED